MEKYQGYKNKYVKFLGNFYFTCHQTDQYILGMIIGCKRKDKGLNVGIALCIANLEVNFGYMFLKKGK